jgi:hypothetical protein
MSSDEGDWTQLQPGFPIRSPPDHSSVANSPGLIAGSYDLHRLSVPRHPPCALSSLSPPRTRQHNKQQKMLASTMQISNNTRTNPATAAYPHPPPPHTHQEEDGHERFDTPGQPAQETKPNPGLDPSGPNNAPPTDNTTNTSHHHHPPTPHTPQRRTQAGRPPTTTKGEQTPPAAGTAIR